MLVPASGSKAAYLISLSNSSSRLFLVCISSSLEEFWSYVLIPSRTPEEAR